jgi:NADPH:quinone reductase-like Zn-dependent oxidoreductase
MKFMGSAQFNPHVKGGFSEYVAVTEQQCLPYADHSKDSVMVFAEPLAVAIHAVHQTGDLATRLHGGTPLLAAGEGHRLAGRVIQYPGDSH